MSLVFFPPLQKATNRADLKEGVTDAGLQALAAAGCGTNLTSLALSSAFLCVPPVPVIVLSKRKKHRPALGYHGCRVARSGAGRVWAELDTGWFSGCVLSLLLWLSSLPSAPPPSFLGPATGGGLVSRNRFATALGLPHKFHDQAHFSLQAVYMHWRLAEDQWRYLLEERLKGVPPSTAVQKWDAEHRFLALPLACCGCSGGTDFQIFGTVMPACQ